MTVTAKTAYDVGAGEREGFATVELRDRTADVAIAFVPDAGLVGCSLRHRGEELLGQRFGVAEYVRTGAVMGIPLLHPWANRLGGFDYEVGGRRVELEPEAPLLTIEEHGLPIHGVLGGRARWTVEELAADADGGRLVASFDYGANPELLAAFPFPHRLRSEARLAGGALELATTVEATGEDDVPIAFGYHPYLRLPGVPREEWHVELPVQHRLVLDERRVPTGAVEEVSPYAEPLDGRTWDDGFVDVAPGAAFRLRGGGRELVLAPLEGFPVAQVFAPPDDAVVCFEPMTAPTDALRRGTTPFATPQRPYRALFRLTVSPAG